MKIGSIVFATAQGLGFLARDFHQHGVITDVGIIHHSSRTNYYEWYPGAPRVGGSGSAREFLREMDAVLFFETPFFWDLIPFCREHKIPTILMTMYECSPVRFPYVPDHILCPSLLDLQHFPKGTYIPVPIPDDVHFRERTTAKTFVHNAGHGGLKGRNGTAEVIRAIPLAKSNAQFIIRSQSPRLVAEVKRLNDPRVSVETGTVPFERLYSEGDVFLFPEKFNGLSLPLQEAYASGMVCMTSHRFPNDQYLPTEPMIVPESIEPLRVAPRFRAIKSAIISSTSIARKVDEWYGRDITMLSRSGADFRWRRSWSVLKPRYDSYLSNILS